MCFMLLLCTCCPAGLHQLFACVAYGCFVREMLFLNVMAMIADEQAGLERRIPLCKAGSD